MRPALVIALLACLVLAACGSSSSTKAPRLGVGPTGLTKAQYIAKADAICRAGKRDAALGTIEKLAFESPIPRTEILTRLRNAAAVFVRVRDGLAALAPPPADSAALKHWNAQIASFSGLVGKAPSQVARGNMLVELAKLAGNLQVADIDPLSFAKDYGMVACSSIGP
jgi:hypothetical protein